MTSLHRWTRLCLGLGLILLTGCGVNTLRIDPGAREDNSYPNVVSIYYYSSASLLFYEGDFASAAELYKLAMEQDPGSTQIKKQFLIASANAYLYSQLEAEPLLNVFDSQRDFLATDADLLNSAYSVYNTAERPEGVQWTIDTMIANFPSSRAYLQKFLADFQRDQKPQESYLKKAYKAAGTNPEELLMVARIYTIADPKRSISILQEINNRSASPEASSLLSEFTLRYGYYRDAKEHFASFSYPADQQQMLNFLQQATKARAFSPVLDMSDELLATHDAALIAELALAAYLEADFQLLNDIFTVLEQKYREPVADAKIAAFLVAAALDSPLMNQPDKYLDYLYGAQDADDILLYRTLRISLGEPADVSGILKNWKMDIANRLPQGAWADYLMAATQATTNADSLLIAARIALCEELSLRGKGYDSDYSYLLSNYHLSKQLSKKLPLLHRALGLYPDKALFLNDLGYSLLDYPDSLEVAGKYIQRAVDQEPENAFYQDSIAWYHYLAGNYPKALEHIQIPLQLENIPSEIAYHIGMILVANGDPALAEKYFQMAADDESAPEYQTKAQAELKKY